jgi:hypothetical protein
MPSVGYTSAIISHSRDKASVFGRLRPDPSGGDHGGLEAARRGATAAGIAPAQPYYPGVSGHAATGGPFRSGASASGRSGSR